MVNAALLAIVIQLRRGGEVCRLFHSPKRIQKNWTVLKRCPELSMCPNTYGAGKSEEDLERFHLMANGQGWPLLSVQCPEQSACPHEQVRVGPDL